MNEKGKGLVSVPTNAQKKQRVIAVIFPKYDKVHEFAIKHTGEEFVVSEAAQELGMTEQEFEADMIRLRKEGYLGWHDVEKEKA